MVFLGCSIHPTPSKTSLFSSCFVLFFFLSSFIHSPLSTFTLLYTLMLSSWQVVTLLRKRTGRGRERERGLLQSRPTPDVKEEKVSVELETICK